MSQGITFTQAGWIKYFDKKGKVKKIYGTEWSADEKVKNILVNGEDILTIKQKNIISEEVDIYA